MAREFARVKLSIWDDDDFRALPTDAQHLYFILLTSPSLTYCGTTDWRPARTSGLAGEWTKEQVQVAAYYLAKERYIVVDETTEEALIRSFIRHDGLMTKPRMAVSMVNAHRSVASAVIRGVIVHELARLHDADPTLAGWQDVHGKAGVALALIEREPVDPVDVADDLSSVCPEVCNAFVANAYSGLQRVCTPTTPAPTPATAEEQTATGESGDSREPDGFTAFWDAYDKKRGRKEALAKYRIALRKNGVTADLLATAAAEYVAWERANNEAGRFVMDASRWLHGEHWTDERVGRIAPMTNTERHMALVRELAEQEQMTFPQIGSGR